MLVIDGTKMSRDKFSCGPRASKTLGRRKADCAQL